MLATCIAAVRTRFGFIFTHPCRSAGRSERHSTSKLSYSQLHESAQTGTPNSSIVASRDARLRSNIVYLIVRANAKPLRVGARENLADPAGIVASRVAHRSDCDQFSGAGDGAPKKEQHGDRASITSKSADALRAKKCARAPPRPPEAPRDAREAAIAASLAPALVWCGRLEARRWG